MTLRRVLIAVLPLLLLFAQQEAFAHLIWHASQKVPSKEHHAHTKLCDKCVSIEKVSYAPPSSSVKFLPLELVFAQHAEADYVFSPRVVAAFHSRAPPVLP